MMRCLAMWATALVTHIVFVIGADNSVLSARDRAMLCDNAVEFRRERNGIIRWLHVPKTGTGFSKTVFRHGCAVPSDYSPEGHVELAMERDFPPDRCSRLMDATPNTHKPIGGRELGALSAFVTMMRSPGARLCSAANDRGGHCTLDCNPENLGCVAPVRGGEFYPEKAVTGLGLVGLSTDCPAMKGRAVWSYADDPAVRGCMTKMMLGLPCNANISHIPDRLIAVAASRLDAFGFVGLVDEWEASICLFHRVYGGSPTRYENVPFGVNPVAKVGCGMKLVTELGKSDPLDALLYEHARRHFIRTAQSVLSDMKVRIVPSSHNASVHLFVSDSVWPGDPIRLVDRIEARAKAGLLPKVVWLLWLQGWDKNVPLLVRDILKSWRLHNPGWDVLPIDGRNVTRFMGGRLEHCLPWFAADVIMGERRCFMSPASVSDVIRVTLLSKYGGVWADATLLCMQPLDSWVHRAVDREGFWMYRGRHDVSHLGTNGVDGLPLALQGQGLERTGNLVVGVPCSWFMVSRPGSVIISTWLHRVDKYWESRKWPSGDVGGLRDYFWFDGLFFVELAARGVFARSWARVPFVDAYAHGMAGLLSGDYQIAPQALGRLRQDLLTHAPFVLKLSYKSLTAYTYRNGSNESPSALSNGEYAVAISLSCWAGDGFVQEFIKDLE